MNSNLHLLDLLPSAALLREEQRLQYPAQHRMLSAAPMELLSKSRATTVMVTAISGAAVVGIITVGADAAATIVVGDIIALVVIYSLRPFRRGRLMCGWPPTCKSFFRDEQWSLAVMCPAFLCDLT